MSRNLKKNLTSKSKLLNQGASLKATLSTFTHQTQLRPTLAHTVIHPNMLQTLVVDKFRNILAINKLGDHE